MLANPSRVRLIDMLLLAVAAVWGSTYLAAKELVTPGSVIAILALRFAVTAVAFLPVCLRRLRAARRDEVATGTLLGVILAVVLLFETFGIAHTSATNAGLIISLTIVMTPILDSAVNRSWLPPQFFLAATAAVVGVGLLASGTGLRPPSAGDWLVLAAAAARAVHVTVMHRRSAQKQYDSLNLTYVQMATAAVLFCAVSPLVGEPAWTVASRLGPGLWLVLLYLALIGTVFAFFVQMLAVRKTSPSRVSLLLGTEPIWALLVGVLLGGDRLGVLGAVGAALILVGAGWGQRIERLHREAKEKNGSVAGAERVPEPAEGGRSVAG
ncbi:DMT family transporter [Streptomyces sp. NPDC053427]|uniref:DMT family transporter n=1 Tax=Streptomyces sp. NPDC053427 TaxID=3365701 RepID=UPI0037D56A92